MRVKLAIGELGNETSSGCRDSTEDTADFSFVIVLPNKAVPEVYGEDRELVSD